MHLTYYRIPDKQISFHLVAEKYVQGLRQLGHQVDIADLDFASGVIRPRGPVSPIGLIHPLFYQRMWHGLDFNQVMSLLRDRHEHIFGLEVADSNSISKRFVDWANHPGLSGIFLPSLFSVQSYKNSGVTTPLGVVPHGVDLAKPSATYDFFKDDPRPKVLFFVLREPLRKGLDLTLKLVEQFPEILFVIKGAPDPAGKIAPVQQAGNLFMDARWLTLTDLASLYTNCDALLSLHRGGAFELNCLEGLGYGLPVVATGFGAVTEYLNASNAHLVRIKGMTEFVSDGAEDHKGLGAEADVADAAEKLTTVLANLNQEKQKAKTEGLKLTSKYSWENAARILAEEIEKMIELKLKK